MCEREGAWDVLLVAFPLSERLLSCSYLGVSKGRLITDRPLHCA